MVSEKDDSQDATLPEYAFAIWANYWVGLGYQVPPIVLKHYGYRSDVVFYAPMGRPDLEDFMNVMKKNEEIRFQMEGEAQINSAQWFGHWCAFSVSARDKRKMPIHPTPPPKVPRSIWLV